MLLSSLISAGFAAAVTAQPVRQLEPFVVEGQAQPPVAASTSTTPPPLTPQFTLDDTLVRIPGVFAQNRNNFAQGLRPAIRGFGARAAFGVRGIRVLLDGVPLTLPDGQTDLDALDLQLLDRVDIVRGPASAVFGNAAGGVIALTTRAAPSARTARIDGLAGSFDTQRLRAELGGPAGGMNWLGAAAHTTSDGPRTHNDTQAQQATLKGQRDWLGGSLTLRATAIDVRAQDPGGLNAEQAAQDREQARPQNIQFDGGERVRQQRLSASWDAQNWTLSAFAGQRAFTARLPFQNGGQIQFDRRFGGLGLTWSHSYSAAGADHRLLIGLDGQWQRDDRLRFDNLEGVRGDNTLAQQESADAAGLYINNTAGFGAWTLQIAGRADTLRLAVDDDFLGDGDDSGRRHFDELSGSVSLARAISDRWSSYARWATAFQTPTNTELANPDGGGFNPALESARSVNYEVGLRGLFAAGRVDLTVFQIDTDDELVPFELPDQPSRRFFRNAGESQRSGVELSTQWTLTETLELALAYTHARYTFESGGNGNTIRGNQLPGLPRNHGHASLMWQRGDWSAEGNLRAVDHLFANDSNTLRVPGYATVDLLVGWQVTARVSLSAGINNLFDRDYNDNVRINAFGGRAFEPAASSNGFLSLNTSF